VIKIDDRIVQHYIQYIMEFTGLSAELLQYLSLREWVIRHASKGLKKCLAVDGLLFIGQMVDINDAKRY
jgi:hypothetical protein